MSDHVLRGRADAPVRWSDGGLIGDATASSVGGTLAKTAPLVALLRQLTGVEV